MAFKLWFITAITGFIFVGCNPNASSPAPTDQGEKKATENTKPDSEGDGSAKVPIDEGTDSSLPGEKLSKEELAEALDIVIVVALSTENPGNRNDISSGISTLFSSAGRELSALSSKDVRIGLVASSTGTVSGIPVDAAKIEKIEDVRKKQVNFEIAPADTFVGSLVTGCDKSQSKMAEPHKPGEITVCGKKATIASHSWTWANEDLFGRLNNFLRPGATRVYILISSGDAYHVEPESFVDIASGQNKSNKPKIYAIVPKTISGFCNSKNKVSTNIMKAVEATGGKSYEFCDSDWSKNIEDLISRIAKL